MRLFAEKPKTKAGGEAVVVRRTESTWERECVTEVRRVVVAEGSGVAGTTQAGGDQASRPGEARVKQMQDGQAGQGEA